MLIPRHEIEFQLYENLDTLSLLKRSRFIEHNAQTFSAVLDTAEKIATDCFLPHNHLADHNEPTFDGQTVSMLPEVKVAYKAFAEAGFIAARYDFAEGGMQLPETVMTACSGYFMAANPSSTGYPFLTTAAANVIKHFANPELKSRYLEPMLSGCYSGTMALTEPHAGSSLAEITTSATLHEDGTYRIKGSKLYISGGDHELTDNIVHLVLAKIPGGPAGVKGISLFIVPKYRGDVNNQVRNDVVLAGLIHKLGYRGTTSTALTFGEQGDCHGYLVGEPHKGLQYMFMMMNEARVGVGYGAAMIGYRGFQYSLEYAKDRMQGGKAIVEHGDVKRMLLAQKAYTEGAIALCFYGARLVDDIHTAESTDKQQAAAELLDLLTPVIKAWPSEYGPKANDLGIQVLGGAGYTREYYAEQFWRDNRLNPIHEGTNGIQALDLLGRKLWQNKQQGLQQLFALIQADCDAAKGAKGQQAAQQLAAYLAQMPVLIQHLGADLQTTKLQALQLTNAECFMKVFAGVVLAWQWLRQINTAEQGLSSELTADQADFYQGKCQAGQYFVRWELPQIDHYIALLQNRDDSCHNMKTNWF